MSDSRDEAMKRLAGLFEGALGSSPDRSRDEMKLTIGLLGARVSELETHAQALAHAVILLVNAKGSGGQSQVPMAVRYRAPRVEIEWDDGEPGKAIGKIRICLTKE